MKGYRQAKKQYLKQSFNLWHYLGFLFIFLALLLTVFNFYEDYEGSVQAKRILASLEEEGLPKLEEKKQDDLGYSTIPGVDNHLMESALQENTLRENTFKQNILEEAFPKNEVKNMPVKKVDGIKYIGELKISKLRLDLPIQESWSYRKIKKTPARYDGSIYNKDLILLAHNYRSHFGTLMQLKRGDELQFQDMDGNLFFLQVVKQEVIQATDIERLYRGDWDLSLFTCTIGGRERVVIRCKMI